MAWFEHHDLLYVIGLVLSHLGALLTGREVGKRRERANGALRDAEWDEGPEGPDPPDPPDATPP